MNITWHGQSMFKVQNKDVTVIVDPYVGKFVGLIPPRPKADIVLVTHDHEDHNNTDLVKGEYKIFDGPGEYEMKGVHIRGVEVPHGAPDKVGEITNTAFVVDMEDIKWAHLGDLGQRLSDSQVEQIGEVDILMVPVGGTFTLDHSQAEEVVNQIEPRIVIPMHYKIPKLKMKLDPVDSFLKDMGASKVAAEPKLSIKKTGLPLEETKVVLLEKS